MATSTIKPKCGTTAQWAASGRVLEVNEWGVEVTESGKHILRIGDGEHIFHELPAVVDTPMLLQLAAQVAALHGESVGYRDAAESAATAATGASTRATSALQGVQDALDNLPDGNTLVINDLTTGGASAALSAEMGKVLGQTTLPRDGSAPMIGEFVVKKAENGRAVLLKNHTETIDLGTYVKDVTADGTEAALVVHAKDNKAYFRNNDADWQELYHTGNKPSGSYTGNGDATSRTIDVGGIGKMLYVFNDYQGTNALVGAFGAITWNNLGTVFKVLKESEVYFRAGILNIATADLTINASNTYYYQVL